MRVGKFATNVAFQMLPYAIFGGNPPAYHGVNSPIIKHVLPHADERLLRHLASTFRLITAGNFSLDDAVIKIHEQIPVSSEIEDITNFISTTELGIIRHVEEEE